MADCTQPAQRNIYKQTSYNVNQERLYHDTLKDSQEIPKATWATTEQLHHSPKKQQRMVSPPRRQRSPSPRKTRPVQNAQKESSPHATSGTSNGRVSPFAMSVKFESQGSSKLVTSAIEPANTFRKAQQKSSNVFGFGARAAMETEYRKQYSPPPSPTRGRGDYAFGMATEVLGSMFPSSGSGGWK